MPTIGSQPSLRSTRLVGAVLLHQFARERFIEAGVSEEIIQEAEEKENLNRLLQDEESGDCNGVVNDINYSMNSTVSVADTTNTEQTTILNVTNTNQDTSHDETTLNEHYHSTVANSTINNDNTLYHSINNGGGRTCNTDEPNLDFDELCSMGAMKELGKKLKVLAEAFERDRKRQEVREHANRVELNDINKENFVKLLEELFQDKITREKIVVLFFFCTDVALRAASFARELVVKLMGWSFTYIINTVCRIVHQLGGWDRILFYQLPSVMVTCCAALGLIALAIHLRKSLRA